MFVIVCMCGIEFVNHDLLVKMFAYRLYTANETHRHMNTNDV